jgi:hypothetical protein
VCIVYVSQVTKLRPRESTALKVLQRPSGKVFLTLTPGLSLSGAQGSLWLSTLAMASWMPWEEVEAKAKEAALEKRGVSKPGVCGLPHRREPQMEGGGTLLCGLAPCPPWVSPSADRVMEHGGPPAQVLPCYIVFSGSLSPLGKV